MAEPLDGAAFDRLEQLLVFPTVFPLKVMGLRVDHFAQEICKVVGTYIPDFDPSKIEMRVSSKGTYLSVTLSLDVVSRSQLEAVYRAVSAHPLVKIVL
jgi:uncharacterized protein